jgi:2-keto-4-pentenoate hydratase/2-oxohepta-3-ene-1,7-dioic acid hydratase in catechol pathway
MKLVRYGPAGKEKPGLVDPEGRLRDLSRKVKDIGPDTLSPASLKALAKLDWRKLPPVKGRPRLGPCVTGVSKFIAIGLNYADHAKESNMPIPEHPVVFFKSTTCIVGPNDNVMIPKDSTQTDWEVELGVVIGKTARHVEVKDALKHVAGYCVINDVSEREFQMKRSGAQWSKGKGCDTFGPLGPWLVTTDEIRDPQNLDMWLDVNGARRQTGNTRRRLALHDAAAGRRDHHRHAAWRGAGNEADAAIPQGRRRDHAGHRGPGRAEAEGGRVPQGALSRRERRHVAAKAVIRSRDPRSRQSSFRRARLRISAAAPNVHGAMRSACSTRLTSAPSRGVAMVTTSPTTWVKPWPGPRRSWVGANIVPRKSTSPSGY